MHKSNHRMIAWHRSSAVNERHTGNAAFAASIARRVSLVPRRGTVPSVRPVPGSVTESVRPLSALIQRPPTKHCWRNRLVSFKSSGLASVNIGGFVFATPDARACALELNVWSLLGCLACLEVGIVRLEPGHPRPNAVRKLPDKGVVVL